MTLLGIANYGGFNVGWYYRRKCGGEAASVAPRTQTTKVFL